MPASPKRSTLFCLSFTLFSFGCAGGKDGDYSCDNSSADGYQTITDGDVTRDYILHLPTGYDATVEYPLVISFHGNGGCAEMFLAVEVILEAILICLPKQMPMVLSLYPQGVARAKGGTEWDPGETDPQISMTTMCTLPSN